MVSSKDTTHYPLSSSMLQRFIISDSIDSHSQHFDDYGGSTLRANETENPGGLPSIQSLGERMSRAMDLVQAPSVAEQSEISHTRSLMDLLGASRQIHRQNQRLSLSLAPHMVFPSSSFQCKQRPLNSEIGCPGYLYCASEARMIENNVSDYYYPSSFSGGTYGMESFAAVVGNSRFLKPAQSLLAEVVSVCDKNFHPNEERGYLGRYRKRGGLKLSSELRAKLCSDGLLSLEKDELQIRIVKLLTLLERVCIKTS